MQWEIGCEDINERWRYWKEAFFKVVDRHAPLVSFRVHKSTLPWIDDNNRKLMRRRNRLRTLASKTGRMNLWASYEVAIGMR